jgi:hypothetical protein
MTKAELSVAVVIHPLLSKPAAVIDRLYRGIICTSFSHSGESTTLLTAIAQRVVI